MLLDGKVALITGGAGGIGKAIGREFIKKNVKICLVDIDEQVKEVATDLLKEFGSAEILSCVCDVTSESDFEDAVLKTKTKFGHLDVVINNAAIADEKNYRRIIDVNLLSVMIGTRLGINHITNKDGKRQGTVINTSSIAGFTVHAHVPAYIATKHAVLGWSKSYGIPEFSQQTGIKVNAVCPGATRTNMISAIRDTSLNPEVVGQRISKITDEMYLSPSEVAKAYVKVLEDDVTGKVLVVTKDKGLFYLPETNVL